MEKYNSKYFSDKMPDWKKKNDPIFVKCFFRPVSFPLASICANIGISANSITIVSIFVAFVANILFFLSMKIQWLCILAAVFINLWLLLDCVDGNLARSVKKQPYGDFLDALGSYVIVAFVGLSMAMNVFVHGGAMFVAGDICIIVLGALSCSGDLLMRLTHQKFMNNMMNLQEAGVIEKEKEADTHNDDIMSLKNRIKMELGIGGILPPLILICSIFNLLDLIVIYTTLYNVCACIVIVLLYIKRTLKYFDVKIN